MTARISKLLAAVGLLASIPISLSGAHAETTLEPSYFQESVDQQVLVGGTIIVGAALADATTAIAMEEVYVFLGKERADEITLTVATANLRYEAVAKYKTSGSNSGWVRLQFPSRQSRVLANATSTTLAAKATDTRAGLMFPIRWGTSAASFVRLYVNAERTQVFFIRSDSRQAQYCVRVNEGTAIRFDTICEVPIAQIRSQPELKIFRQRGNTFLDPVTVRIARPGS